MNEMGVMGSYKKELVILVKALYGFNITPIFVAVKDIKNLRCLILVDKMTNCRNLDAEASYSTIM